MIRIDKKIKKLKIKGMKDKFTPTAARRKPRVSGLGDEPPLRPRRSSPASEEEAPTLRGRGVFTRAWQKAAGSPQTNLGGLHACKLVTFSDFPRG